jgi:hypothetical protein
MSSSYKSSKVQTIGVDYFNINDVTIPSHIDEMMRSSVHSVDVIGDDEDCERKAHIHSVPR